MRQLTFDQRMVLGLSLAIVAACGGKGEPPAPRVEAQPAADDRAKQASPSDTALPQPDEPPVALARATAAASVTAKGQDHLGFELAALAQQYAIGGVVRTPSWGDAGTGEALLTRDDDIDTAWTCTADGTRVCAIGLSFSEPVELTAVRLFATAGPKWTTYRAHPRPKRVRVHTDVGFVDAKLEDGSAHRYVVLAQPIVTRTVTVEVTELYAGGKDQQVHVAELEAFGRTGPHREPLEIDPERAFVSFETDPWKPEGAGNTIRLVFVGTLDDEGKPHRLVRGTAMFGRTDDRFVVIERLLGDGCTSAKGGYLVLDRHTRVMAPLVDKQALPARIALLPGGTGALMVHDDPEPSARAVIWANDKLTRERPREKKGETPEQFATRLGFTEPVLARGGHHPGAAAAGCLAGSSDAALVETIAAATAVPELSAQDVSICPLSATHRVVIGVAGSCGRRVVVAVVGAAGEIVGTHVGKPDDARGAWYLPIESLGVLIESSTKLGARALLLRASIDGITTVADGGGLAVRRPVGCEACEGDYGIAPGITAEITADDGADADAGAPAEGGAAPAGDADDGAPPADDGAPPAEDEGDGARADDDKAPPAPAKLPSVDE